MQRAVRGPEVASLLVRTALLVAWSLPATAHRLPRHSTRKSQNTQCSIVQHSAARREDLFRSLRPASVAHYRLRSIQMAAYDTVNVWTAASDGDLETVRRCIENGMAPHTPDAQGYTCLHAAASYGHHELLRFLIARPGVNLNCGDEDGDTPLHVVEDVESCRMLLAAGADASVRNGDGLSPAGNARGEGRDAIADLLAQAHPAAAAADDASVIAARREAAADGDEAMEKLELSLNQLSEAAGVPATEENSNKRARV